jgi:hypothetical protein
VQALGSDAGSVQIMVRDFGRLLELTPVYTVGYPEHNEQRYSFFGGYQGRIASM